ncbi:MAG: hypothetical protein ACLU99_02850 [Alphaproteobacteria bacterium]
MCFCSGGNCAAVFFKQTVCKKISHRLQNPYGLLPRSQFDELLRNDRLACGGIVCQGMDWFSLLAFVAAIFHLFVFKKIKKHKRSCDIALRDNESDKEKAHKAALNDYQNWLRHFFLCLIVIAIVAVIIKSYC